MRAPGLSALLALPLFSAACTSSPSLARSSPECVLVDQGWGPAGASKVDVETVVSGLDVPWGLAFLPGGDLLVTERPGRVRRIHEGRALPPLLTLNVGKSGEGGLLGLALHPDFEKNRLFYVYATIDENGSRSNRVVRYRMAADGGSATLDKVIFESIPGAQYHDGGRLRFGPDGMLYVGTGDAREPDLAQSPGSPAGKLLRLTPDGAIPPDNPSPNNPAFLTGIRNTQGWDWLDAKTLVVTDHGPSGELGRSGHDEVSVAAAGDNLGWPEIYGCEAKPGFVTPSISWERAAPPGGAAIYTGKAIPEWRGSLIIGTLGSKHLHRVVFDPADRRRVAHHEVYFQGDPPGGYGRLREVIMGPDGELYVTTSNCDGRGDCGPDRDKILRITRR